MIRPLDGPGKQTVKTTRSLALFVVRLLRKPQGLDRHAPDYLLAESASIILKRARSRDPALRLTRDEGSLVLMTLKTVPIPP
jgi:hypothetical protein